MRSILVVDDSPSDLMRCENLLSSHFFRVLTARTLQEAISAVEREGSPDVILIDCNLASDEPSHLLQKLCTPAKKNGPKTRIVGYSHSTLLHPLVQQMERYLHGFISKTCKWDDFLGKIETQWHLSPAASLPKISIFSPPSIATLI